tara:strand:- start:4448 stop:5248 length:801 start_codon:yes stop_codon:yes gene_type:complete
MFYKFFYYIFNIFPFFKKIFWKNWYTIFANKVPDIQFMNYGFASEGLNLNLKEEDIFNRYSINLYHHVATQVNLENKKILEIGSGRGGGASYISRYLNTKEVVGLDISPSAVKNCNKKYNIDNLSFITGDSENLPFENNTFDAIINVESSHCYTSMNKFIDEVTRVLKPGGYFLFCDLRKNTLVEDMLSSINTEKLQLKNSKEITQNIIEATILMSKERKESIENLDVGMFKRIIESFSAVEGSKVHNSLIDGYLRYFSAYSQKTH